MLSRANDPLTPEDEDDDEDDDEEVECRFPMSR